MLPAVYLSQSQFTPCCGSLSQNCMRDTTVFAVLLQDTVGMSQRRHAVTIAQYRACMCCAKWHHSFRPAADVYG